MYRILREITINWEYGELPITQNILTCQLLFSNSGLVKREIGDNGTLLEVRGLSALDNTFLLESSLDNKKVTKYPPAGTPSDQETVMNSRNSPASSSSPSQGLSADYAAQLGSLEGNC